MFPPHQNVDFDIRALSGICGSISIACWVVVFSPQIVENFRRGSAEGLSIVFIVAWLVGDVFNILGAVLQGVLPTMIILAVYYTLADIVLLGQCFWYKGFTLNDFIEESPTRTPNGDTEHTVTAISANERTPLFRPLEDVDESYSTDPTAQERGFRSRRSSHQSFRERLLSLDGTRLSPVVSLVPDPKPQDPQPQPPPPRSTLQAVFINAIIVLLVCFAGVLGWYLSLRHPRIPSNLPPSDEPAEPEPLEFNVLGQIFGYVCAVLYLGSRIPQLLLNFRRQSTEGVSMLFFLFACIGNLTYVMSIFAYDPSPACRVPGKCEDGEAGRMYGRYVLVNLSWLFGSLGTLMLDAGVFVQYFLYMKDEDEDDEEVEVRRVDPREELASALI